MRDRKGSIEGRITRKNPALRRVQPDTLIGLQEAARKQQEQEWHYDAERDRLIRQDDLFEVTVLSLMLVGIVLFLVLFILVVLPLMLQ